MPPPPPITTTAPHSRWQCFEDAGEKGIIPLSLDAASLAVDIASPESQYVKLAAGVGISTAQVITSAVESDVAGVALGMASYHKAAADLASSGMHWGWAKWLPEAGTVLDVASLAHDISQAAGTFNACMEK